MCEFCKNIRKGEDQSATMPYLAVWNGNDGLMFYINIPTDDIDYSVDDIKFCPYCSRKLSEVSENVK